MRVTYKMCITRATTQFAAGKLPVVAPKQCLGFSKFALVFKVIGASAERKLIEVL